MAENLGNITNQSGSKGEFLDAVRRHICQILGFDYGFIDAASGHEITNVASFCFDDEDGVASEFVESLLDEHKQPITVANTLVAQKVKQTQRAWVGKAYAQEDVAKGIEEDAEGFPYVIVPVLDNPGGTAGQVTGLIRVIAFDAGRDVTAQDLTTLKLMGEHLASRTGLFGMALAADASSSKTRVSGESAELEHILTVHGNRLVRRRFNRILGNQYTVLEADTSERALEMLDENRVDVILLDSELQGASGFGFCKVLKESSKWKHIPVILVVAENNTNARVEGLNVGADDCLADSCLDQELVARVRSSLRHRKAERELGVQLQLLEDFTQRLERAHEQLSLDRQNQIQKNAQLEQLRRDSEVLRHQDNLLHRISNIIRKSFNIKENLEEMLEALSGWFSLDCAFVVMPSDEELEDTIRVECVSDKNYKVQPYDRDLDIYEVFKKHFQADQAVICNDAANDRRLDPFHKLLKSGFPVQSLFYIPVNYEQKLLGLLVGYKCETRANWSRINETFMKSVADQVANGVVNARLYARVQRQATTDGLTGLFNHRTGQEKLAEQLKQAERYDRRLSVIMLDVDHFKSINDTYGHPAGDTVLKSVARLIKNNCRDVDIPVRYGGEEFLLVLPEITQEGAMVVAERIRNALKQELIKHEDTEITITGSFGVASFPDDAGNQQNLLDLADKSLYLSKRLGRDQVHTASHLMFEEEQKEEPKTSEDVAQEIREHGNRFTPPTISDEAREQEELVPEVVDMVKSLASSLYAKSEYNKQHHLEVARMSELLAKVMGLSTQQVEQIRVAGLLHDVGLLQLPEHLLDKHGHLTTEEREQVNQHATLGAQMLRPVRALKDICEILENHHERWDGTGYPKGLKGEGIPLSARIVAIVDSYHAMISERPYRPAMSHDESLKILRDGAGKQWDPFLVEIFSAVMKSMRETSQEIQAKVAGAQALASAKAREAAENARAENRAQSSKAETPVALKPESPLQPDQQIPPDEVPPVTQWGDEPQAPAVNVRAETKQSSPPTRGSEIPSASAAVARVPEAPAENARASSSSFKITAEPLDHLTATAQDKSAGLATEKFPGESHKDEVASRAVLPKEEAFRPVIKPIISPAKFKPMSLSDPTLEITKTLNVAPPPEASLPSQSAAGAAKPAVEQSVGQTLQTAPPQSVPGVSPRVPPAVPGPSTPGPSATSPVQAQPAVQSQAPGQPVAAAAPPVPGASQSIPGQPAAPPMSAQPVSGAQQPIQPVAGTAPPQPVPGQPVPPPPGQPFSAPPPVPAQTTPGTAPPISGQPVPGAPQSASVQSVFGTALPLPGQPVPSAPHSAPQPVPGQSVAGTTPSLPGQAVPSAPHSAPQPVPGQIAPAAGVQPPAQPIPGMPGQGTPEQLSSIAGVSQQPPVSQPQYRPSYPREYAAGHPASPPPGQPRPPQEVGKPPVPPAAQYPSASSQQVPPQVVDIQRQVADAQHQAPDARQQTQVFSGTGAQPQINQQPPIAPDARQVPIVNQLQPSSNDSSRQSAPDTWDPFSEYDDEDEVESDL